MTWLLLIPILLAGALSPAETGSLVERYGRAQEAIADKDHAEAQQILESLVREYGHSDFGDELRFSLAETHFNAGDFERSRNMFRQILDGVRHDYVRPEAMYGEALSMVMLGQYEPARTQLDALSRYSGYDRDERTGFAFGLLHYLSGEYDQAISRLTGLALPEARFYLAKSQSMLGRPLRALQVFNDIVAEAPASPVARMAHFAAGEALFTNRDYEGARAKFQLYIDRFPESPLTDYAYYYLGCALFAQRRYTEAVRFLTPLADHDDEFLASHANYFIGQALMSSGAPAEAVERYQRVRSGFPDTRIAGFAGTRLAQAILATGDTVQTLTTTGQMAQVIQTGAMSGAGGYFSGVILLESGRHAEAAEQFEQVMVGHAGTPLREPAAAMMLVANNAAGRYGKAASLGTRYVEDYPNEPAGWRAQTLFALAEAFYYDGKYSDADVFYQRSYGHAPGADIALHARLGRCFALYHLGRLREAAEGFEALRDSRPADTMFTISAYLGSGYAAFNQGINDRDAYNRALGFFEALTATYPDNPLAAVPGYYHTGYCYYQLGYYGDAVDAWTLLVNRFPEQDPKAAEAAFRTGETYFRAGNYGSAIASLTFVIERHPGSVFAPLSQALIAQCYAVRNMHSDAVREYRKFLELYPTDPQVQGVHESLRRALYLDGSPEAVAELEREYPGSEEIAKTWYDRGKGLYEERRYDEAGLEFQKVVVNAPISQLAAEAQLMTAESYAQQKQWIDAANAYRKFIDWYPNHPQEAGAWFMLGTTSFNAGEFQRSLDAFTTVINEYPDSEYAEGARTNASISRQRLGSITPPPAPETPEPGPDAPSPEPLPEGE